MNTSSRLARIVLAFLFANALAVTFGGCIMPAGVGGYGYGGQYMGGGGYRQPMYDGQQYIQQPPAAPVMMGTYDQTYAAAQQRAQAVAAGTAPPVAAYQNPNRPIGFIQGTGAPTWSVAQCWNQGCVMP